MTRAGRALGGLIVAVCGVLSRPLPAADTYEAARLKMVEEDVVREGIRNPRVIEVLKKVPRHEFVPSKLYREAYIDKALPIGHQQTISPPYIVAYMTESLDPQPGDKVLEIGTGSGYQAAVLSGLVQEVYSIEIVAPLGNEARTRLKRLGYSNVHCRVGDGYQGWPEAAPFDGIIVTCSPESVPQPLVDQLKEGGRMIVPMGERFQQTFYLMQKQDGKLVPKRLIPTLFVPMTGISEDRRVAQPDPARPQIVNGSFEIDANADERADSWHYQRQTERLLTGATDGTVCLRFRNEESGRPAQILQGLAIDGRKVATINLSLDVKVEQPIQPGDKSFEQPALYIHFYDQVRRELETSTVGPWVRRQDWERDGRKIVVPPGAREAIIRVGLNGAVGTLSIDNVKLSFVPR